MPARRHRVRRPQLEASTQLVARAAAQSVVEEVSVWLGVPLPARYAAGLAFRARRCFAHSPSFREKLRRPGEAGRDRLWLFMRHWLAARLQTELPHLYACLPGDYALGADLPELPPARPADDPWLSPAARQLA